MSGSKDHAGELALDPALETFIRERIESGIEERMKELKLREQEQDQGVTIVVFSGDMDRIFAALAIASGAAAMEMPVSLFFTFWGLTALKRKRLLKGKRISEKMMSLMLPASIEKLGPSRFNMLGIGRAFFKKVMRGKKVSDLRELMDLCAELGVERIACQLSMEVMGIAKEELIEGVEFGGVSTYLGAARRSRVTLFI